MILTNSAEGGTSGVAPTPANSGGTSGDPWGVVTVGTGASVLYDNARSAHGALAYKVSTTGTSAQAACRWTPGVTMTTAWYRTYIYLTALPTVLTRILSVWNGASIAASLMVMTTGRINITPAAGGTSTTLQNATAIPLNQWVRVEVRFDMSTTVGAADMRIYTDPDSATVWESKTVSAQVYLAAVDNAQYGISPGAINAGPYWFDDLGFSDTDWVGPVASGSPVTYQHAVQIG